MGPSTRSSGRISTPYSGSSLVISTTDGFRTLAKANTEIDTPNMSPDGSKIAYADGGTAHVVDISTEESQKSPMGAWPRGSMGTRSSWPTTASKGRKWGQTRASAAEGAQWFPPNPRVRSDP